MHLTPLNLLSPSLPIHTNLILNIINKLQISLFCTHRGLVYWLLLLDIVVILGCLGSLIIHSSMLILYYNIMEIGGCKMGGIFWVFINVEGNIIV